MLNLNSNNKRDHPEDDPPSTSSTYKKLKNDLNLLFSGLNNAGNNNSNQSTTNHVHPNTVQYDQLAMLDEIACKAFLETLKHHGFYRVVKLPKEFVNACNDLYASSKSFFNMDDSFKVIHFPEKDVETGYRAMKERELSVYRKGYIPDNKGNDPAKDLATKFENYYNEASKVSVVVFNALVKALGGSIEQARGILPLSETGLSTNVARAFNYFETLPHTVTCSPHQDIGLLTLVPANFPGLQVYSVCGNCGMGWEQTHKGLEPTDIVVISGQCMCEFSNGYIPAALHQVVSEPNPQFGFLSNEQEEKKPAKGKRKKADNKPSSAQQIPAKPKVGRIALPFLLRAKNDIPMSGALIGLGGKPEGRLVGDFVDEERKRRLPGLY